MKSFLLIFISILTVSWINGCERNGEKDKYYRTVIIDGNYAIKGKYPLAADKGKKCESYRFSYNNGELVRVDHLLGGALKEGSFFGSDVARVKIKKFETYEKRTYFDANDSPVMNEDGVYSISVRFDGDSNPVAMLNYDRFGGFAEDNYGVAQYSWTTDEEGLITGVIFYDFLGKRITIDDGGFKTIFKYDEKGNMIEQSYLDSKGNLEENKKGVAVLRREFDDNGNIIEISYFDKNDKLTELSNGIAVEQQEFDEYGNIIETRYLGKDEGLKENNMGVAMVKCEFDDCGNIIEQRYYDLSGDLTEGKFYGFAIRQWDYDEKSRVTETRFLGIDGELKNVINEEAAVLRMKYDENGNLEEVLHFDKEGNPVEDTVANVP